MHSVSVENTVVSKLAESSETLDTDDISLKFYITTNSFLRTQYIEHARLGESGSGNGAHDPTFGYKRGPELNSTASHFQ